MADNSQKTWYVTSQDSFADRKVDDGIQLLGKALPCHVTAVDKQFVTVAFDVQGPYTLPAVKMPIQTSKYAWVPIQLGDHGVATPGDVYIGGASGQGGGTADFTTQSNLSTLWFTPISHTSFNTPNPNQYVVQGPEGALMQDTAGKSQINVGTAGIKLILTSGTVEVDGGNITVMGHDVIAEGISLKNHVHSGVIAGGDDTGPPV